MMSRWCHRACRWGLALALTIVVGIAVHAWLIPQLVTRYLTRELADRGFPAAKLRVQSVGVDHVRLADVQLADGMSLGDVELDAGWSLLWRPARTLTIRGAHLSQEAIERWAGSGGAKGGGGPPRDPVARLPIEQLRLADCTVEVDHTSFVVSGTIALASSMIDLRATTPAWNFGPLALRGIAVTARSAGGTIRTCVHARVNRLATAEACTTIPRENILATRVLDIEWSAASRGELAWSASGDGRVAWKDRAVHVDRAAVEVHAPAAKLGEVLLDDAHVRGTVSGALTAANEIRIDRSQLELTAAAAAVDNLRARDLKLGGTVSGKVMASREVRVERSKFELTVASAAMAKLSLDDVKIGGTASGALAALSVAGTARARRAAVRGPHATRLASVSMPFALRMRTVGGPLAIVALAPVVATAHHVSLVVRDSPLRATKAVFSLRPKGTLPVAKLGEPAAKIPWHASSFEWRELVFASPSGTLSFVTQEDAQHVAWKRIDGGGPLAFGKGFVDVREVGNASQVITGKVETLGGTLTVAAPQAASGELTLDVRGVPVPRVLAAASQRVEATGVLDGTLVVLAEERGCSLRRLSLWARGPGVLRVRDPKVRAAWGAAGKTKLSGRVHGALADFAYSSLTFMLAPPGSSPEVQLAITGQGRLIKQALDLVINVRGVRDAVQKFLPRVSR